MDAEKENKPKQKILGLNRNVFFMGLVSFFNDFSNEMILSVFPAFFAGVLKAGAASLGLVEGIADGASQIIKIFSGKYSDKFQKRKLPAVLGYALSVAIRPFYMFVSKVPSALLLRATDRIGKGVREAPRDSLISLSVPSNELGRSFGFHRAMDTLGGIAGPLVAYLILKSMPENFNAVFGASFVIGLIAILSFIFVKEVTVVTKYAKSKEKVPLPSHFKMSLFTFFILSLGTLPVALLLLKTTDHGFELSSIPLFYLIYSVCYSAFSFRAGMIADKIGDKMVLIVGYLFLIASYIALAYDGLSGLLISFILLGISAALTDGIQRAFISRISVPEARGTAIGFLNGAAGLGLLLAGIGGGWLWQNSGASYALLMGGLVVAFGIILLYIQTKKQRV